MTDATETGRQAALDRRLAPGDGLAIELDAGQRLAITDVDGQQVANLVCYNRDDVDEFLETAFSYSQIRQKDQQLTLYSDRGNRMLDTIEDSVGIHYLRGDLCTAGELEVRFGVDEPPNCHDTLQLALSDYGVSDWLPFPVGVFRSVEEHRNEYKLLPAASRPGDTLEFVAEMDVVVGLCACPNRWDPRNGYRPSPIDVTVYPTNGGEAD